MYACTKQAVQAPPGTSHPTRGDRGPSTTQKTDAPKVIEVAGSQPEGAHFAFLGSDMGVRRDMGG